jgi:hypothetical protein
MSLTRAEWQQMWMDVKTLESYFKTRKNSGIKAICLKRIDDIKDKIQQVIGQME